MTTITVSSGQTSSGLTLNNSDQLLVQAGGTSSATVVNPGGKISVLSGGNDFGATLQGGAESVFTGGTASGITVLSGGQDSLLGGVAIGTSVNSGGKEAVFSTSIASRTAVNSGGTEQVLSGGLTVSATLNGGTENVFAGGIASGTQVNGGTENVAGLASGGTVNTGVENVQSGGIARDGLVQSSGVQKVLSGGLTTNMEIGSGGVQTVVLGGIADNTKVDKGGIETIAGKANGTSVLSGAIDSVGSGGLANGTLVASGGKEAVFVGGAANGSFISSGALEQVLSGGTANGVNLIGGIENVFTGGLTHGAIVGSGSTENLIGGVGRGTMVNAGGTQVVQGTGLAVGTLLTGGRLQVLSGGATTGAILSKGTETVFTGGTASGSVVSGGGTEALQSAGIATDSTVLLGGVIDISYLNFGVGGSAVVDLSTNVLTVTEGAKQYTQHLQGSYAGLLFSVSQDSIGGTNVTATACFCEGTRILTDRGEVAVQHLAAGDLVVTASGALSAVRWIGWRKLELAGHADRARVQPVRIGAGTFGPGQPCRDLLLSPEHAIHADGVLIPARHLVGCPGIAADTTLDRTTYYHVELAQHDVLFADGLACESWLDTGNRAMFENAPVASLHFAEGITSDEAWTNKACAMLVTDGPVLDAVRRRITAGCVQQVELSQRGRHRFEIAPGGGAVCLVSATGSAAGDVRSLGVAVDGAWLDGTPIALDDGRLGDGFHLMEAAWRWTDGAAHLALGCSDAVRQLVVSVTATAQTRAA